MNLSLTAHALTRPERVQAAFEVWRNNAETGPNASALFEYIEALEAALATAREQAIRECAEIAIADEGFSVERCYTHEDISSNIERRILALLQNQTGEETK